MSMPDIVIRRVNDPHWVGCIEPTPPEQRRWKLCIDDKGLPKLFLLVATHEPGETPAYSWMDLCEVGGAVIADLLTAETTPFTSMTDEEVQAMTPEDWDEVWSNGTGVSYRPPFRAPGQP